MKIISIKHKENKVYFKSPYNVDGVHILDFKYSDILDITFQNEKETINLTGEISYLPYFHKFEYQEILEALSNIIKKLPFDSNELKHFQMPSSLQFAFDHVLYKKDNVLNTEVKTNSLITLDLNNLHTIASDIVKIKIGRNDFKEEVKILNHLMKQFPSKRFRLDANQKLNKQTILPYLDLDMSRIDYFEEPFAYIEDIKKFQNIPIALDENINILKNEVRSKNIVALVIKPSCYGLETTLEWIDYAREENIRTIFSSTFESKTGTAFIKSLAHKYAPNEYHGLDTEHYLKL